MNSSRTQGQVWRRAQSQLPTGTYSQLLGRALDQLLMPSRAPQQEPGWRHLSVRSVIWISIISSYGNLGSLGCKDTWDIRQSLGS